MKVGICGCYSNHNYGSMLQAYANERAVISLGHECEFVRYQKNYNLLEMVKQLPRLFNGAWIASYKKSKTNRELAEKYPNIQRRRLERDCVFDAFCKATFKNLSEPYVGYAALQEGSRKYDAVQVGSDQLWLPMGLATNFYNLEFVAPRVRRISYSTSFGVSAIPWYQRSRTADFLKKIDFLSVREDSGAAIVKSVAGIDAEVVVDPTLLLTAEQWADAVPVKRVYEEPYIFCYFLGSNPLCRDEAQTLSNQVGLPIVVLRHLDDIISSDEEFGDVAPYDIDPAGFVNLIRGAEYVLTDSFHGSVFSIIHHKKFATFYRFQQENRQSRNSRIDNLFGRLGLENLLVTESTGVENALSEGADFCMVDEKLAAWRKDSWDFLRRALS